MAQNIVYFILSLLCGVQIYIIIIIVIIIIIIIIIIVVVVSFMQGIHTHIPETNHVPRG